MVGSSARMPERRSRQSDFGQAGPQTALSGDECGPSRSAALLGIVIREEHAFLRDAIDIRGLVPQHSLGENAEVGLSNIIAPDDEEVWFLFCHGVGSLKNLDPPVASGVPHNQQRRQMKR